jgi:hypothetical protein
LNGSRTPAELRNCTIELVLVRWRRVADWPYKMCASPKQCVLPTLRKQMQSSRDAVSRRLRSSGVQSFPVLWPHCSVELSVGLSGVSGVSNQMLGVRTIIVCFCSTPKRGIEIRPSRQPSNLTGVVVRVLLVHERDDISEGFQERSQCLATLSSGSCPV